MEEVSDTTHNEYGQRANWVRCSLDKFDSIFGLKFGRLLFGAAAAAGANSCFTPVKEYYRKDFFEACNLLVAEPNRRFDHKRPVIAVEEVLL